MFALALAAACALTVADVGEVEGQSLPTLPPLPQVQLPSLPKTNLPKPPALQPPSQLPETPELPSVRLPRVEAPSPAAPGAGSTPDVAPGRSLADSPGAGRTAAGGSAGAASGTRAATGPKSRSGGTTQKRAAVRKRKASTRRERRFRRAVRGLWACSYAVGGFERNVLIRRAGLDGFSPASPGAVAQQLGVSVKRIRRAQRIGVRSLRAANRSDGCAMSSPSPAVGHTIGTLRAVATAPALVTDGDPAADAPALPDSELADQGDVLGDQADSTGVQLKRPQLAGSLSAAAGGDDGAAPWLLILILALIALAAATPLLLYRRRQASPAPANHQPPPVIPTPAAKLWVEPEAEPWPEPEPEREPESEPEPEPEPEPQSDPRAQDRPPRYDLPPAPWTESEPEPGQDAAPTSPEPKTNGSNGSRRASGITFSLMAYLAVTLMMRTRRRR